MTHTVQTILEAFKKQGKDPTVQEILEKYGSYHNIEGLYTVFNDLQDEERLEIITRARGRDIIVKGTEWSRLDGLSWEYQ